MIAVEGVDGAGKTTLLKQLAIDRPDIRILKSPFQPEFPELLFPNCLEMLIEYCDSTNVFVDRFFFSELVYGPILRGGLYINAAGIQSLLNIFREGNNFIVWCSPPMSTVKESAKASVQQAGVLANLEKLYWSYVSLFTVYRERPVFLYDWTTEGAYETLLRRL